LTQRALFPSDVRVRSTTLAHGADATAEEIRQLAVDTFPAGGRVSGLQITCNGTDDVITSISAGTARAPNGESIVIAEAQLATPLADETDGTSNFVCAVYRETAGTPLATTTGQTSQNTQVIQASTIEVLTSAQYAALPATALDRTTIIGTVLGAGASTAIPAANVTQDPLSSELRGVTLNVYSTTMPGISVISISDNAPLGTLTLEYTPTAGSMRASFSTGGYGAAVTGIATATQAVLSGGGTPAATVVLTVIPELLPTTGAAITTTLNVIAPFIDDDAQPATVIDNFLRGLQGSSARTIDNPLGVGLRDLASAFGGMLPGLLSLGSDLLGSNALSDLPRLFMGQSTVATSTLLIQVPIIPTAGARVYARLYAQSGRLILTLNARLPNGASTWYSDSSGSSAMRLDLILSGLQLSMSDASGVSWSDSGGWNARSVWGTGAMLTLGAGYLDASTATRSRLYLPYSDTSGYRTALLGSFDDSVGQDNGLTVYRVGGTGALELVFNAAYTNGSGTPWAAANTAIPAFRVVITNDSLTFGAQVDTSVAWASWPSTGLTYNGSANTWTLEGGDLTVEGTLDVTGATTIGGNVAITGNLSYTGTLNGDTGARTIVWLPGPNCILRRNDAVDYGISTNAVNQLYHADNYLSYGDGDITTNPPGAFTTGLQILGAATGDQADVIIPFPPLPDQVRVTSFTMWGAFTPSASGAAAIVAQVYQQATDGSVLACTGSTFETVGAGTSTTVTMTVNNEVDLTGGVGGFFGYIWKNDPSLFGLTRFSLTYEPI